MQKDLAPETGGWQHSLAANVNAYSLALLIKLALLLLVLLGLGFRGLVAGILGLDLASVVDSE